MGEWEAGMRWVRGRLEGAREEVVEERRNGHFRQGETE